MTEKAKLFQSLGSSLNTFFFWTTVALDNVESRDTSSYFMLQQPEISVSLVDNLACTAV